MRRLLALLLCAMLLSMSLVLADQPYESAMRSARQTLEHQGYPVSDEACAMALEQINMMQEWYAQTGIMAAVDQHDMVYQLLLCEGIGGYDYDTVTVTFRYTLDRTDVMNIAQLPVMEHLHTNEEV